MRGSCGVLPAFRFRVKLAAFLDEVARSFSHSLLQRFLFGDALFGSVFRTSLVIFIEQKCGPHIE